MLLLHVTRGCGYTLRSTQTPPVAHELARIAATPEAVPRDLALDAAPSLAPRRAH